MLSTCSNLNDSRFNVDQRVLDYFAAHLIRHYPQFKLLKASAPAVKRLEECVINAECQLVNIMIWSMKLNGVEHVEERNGNYLSNDSNLKQHKNNQATIKFQAAVISGLLRWISAGKIESHQSNPNWRGRKKAILTYFLQLIHVKVPWIGVKIHASRKNE